MLSVPEGYAGRMHSSWVLAFVWACKPIGPYSNLGLVIFWVSGPIYMLWVMVVMVRPYWAILPVNRFGHGFWAY